jgi:hypothetical protein
MPGDTMRPPRSIDSSGIVSSSKKVDWLEMILPVRELTQRSSLTRSSPLTRRQFVNRVMPFFSCVGERAMGMMGGVWLDVEGSCDGVSCPLPGVGCWSAFSWRLHGFMIRAALEEAGVSSLICPSA